jgi:type I restriction enzyme, R subunit
LSAELSQLRTELDKERSAAEKARLSAEEHERAKLSAEERARKESEERSVWEQLAAEAESSKSALAAQFRDLQAAAAQAPAQTKNEILAKAEEAAAEISIDEASTRALIDEQLRARGWEADTVSIRYGTGSRPAKGRNLAIAEWPTTSGPADYALFVGTRCIGVVEAKRRNKTGYFRYM